MFAPSRFALICVTSLVAACGGAAPATPEVELTIGVDSSVTNDALATIESLALHATGDETYDHAVTLSRPLQRDERIVYDASAATRAVTIEIDALDKLGHVVASGSTSSLALSARARAKANITLSASTPAVDMAMGPTYAAAVLADAPLLYYRFAETSGTAVVDSSGNGRSGLYESTIDFGEPGAIVGDSSTAISLGADDAYAGVDDQASFGFSGNAPWSLEIWLNPTTIDANYHLLFNWSYYDASDARQHYGIYTDSTDGLQLERMIADQEIACDVPAPALGQWSHIVGTYDGATLRLYVNGTLGCKVDDTRPFPVQQAPLYITNGGPGWHALLDATFDEAAVYATALPAARVLAHYQAAR
jgi:hypothetical protein